MTVTFKAMERKKSLVLLSNAISYKTTETLSYFFKEINTLVANGSTL